MPKKPTTRKDQNRVPRAPRNLAPVEPREAERVAKVVARAGLGSRREIEDWIAAGRVAVNGEVLESPARTVTPEDVITVDGQPIPAKERTRLYLYHKPKGVVTTNYDPEGRPTLFEILPAGLPRLVSVGRLDLTTEGLILLTNDGGLARILELPETGWLRRYRVRAKGDITQDKLDALIKGITVEGVHYGPIEAVLDRVQGSNVWMTLALREGKNREVRNVLSELGLQVNRLIRLSYGPFQLAEIAQGAVEEVRTRVLSDQIGPELAAAAGADFTGPMFDHAAAEEEERPAWTRAKAPDGEDRHRRRPISTAPSEDKTVSAGILSDRKGRKFLVQRVRSNEPEHPGEEERPPRAPRREREGGERGFRPRGERPQGDRPHRARSEGDRPARSRTGEDRPFRPRGDRPEGDRPPRRERPEGDRPFRARTEGDRPARSRAGEDRTFRPRGDRPEGDRPPRRERPEGDRPFRPRSERPEGGRPPRRERPEGDRPFRARPEGDRPARPHSGGDRPFRPRGERPEGDRPFRERPPRREGSDEGRSFRPRGERPEGDRPPRERPEGDRPFSSRPEGDRPFRERAPRREGPDEGRSFRPRTERPEGGRPPRRERPEGERPFRSRSEGDRPFRPRSERPEGDRPRRRERPEGDRPFRPRGERPAGTSGERPYSGRVKSERPHGSGGKPAFDKPRGPGKSGSRPGGKPAGSRPGGKPGGKPGGSRGPKPRG
ncbi:MAG: RNA-binding domain protein [Xanthobacteraceae bacterium]|nr:RNA-binding domain protein [Xanthobacteraceae bacterium]